MALPKWTDRTSQRLNINGRAVTIPAETMVIPSLLAIQTHPKYWASDPLVWRPSRWITSNAAANPSKSLNQEKLFQPVKGTYFPWSEGPQHCPGKKFAQVEFVAVLACLFKDHHVRAQLAEGETYEHARKRLLAVAEDSELGLLLRMRRADDVRLVWARRAP